jgi:hypothetical protein
MDLFELQAPGSTPKEKQIQRCSEILKSGWSLIGKSYGLMVT